MYFNDKYTVTINIDLEDGLYIFNNESATGKTRLFKQLRKHETYGEPVSTYTYTDKLRGRKIDEALIPNKYQIIILDRYDMYEGEGAALIKECAKNSIVLVDCKGAFTIGSEDKWCDINMSADTIEVLE